MLPFVALLALLLWQLAVAGQAVWLAGAAARAAARAQAVGADAADGARGVLPPRFEEGLRVRTAGDGMVAVTLGVPLVVGGGTLTGIESRARFESQGA